MNRAERKIRNKEIVFWRNWGLRPDEIAGCMGIYLHIVTDVICDAQLAGMEFPLTKQQQARQTKKDLVLRLRRKGLTNQQIQSEFLHLKMDASMVAPLVHELLKEGRISQLPRGISKHWSLQDPVIAKVVALAQKRYSLDYIAKKAMGGGNPSVRTAVFGGHQKKARGRCS